MQHRKTRTFYILVILIPEFWIKKRALSFTPTTVVYFTLADLLETKKVQVHCSLQAEALFLVFADGRKEISAMGRKWL